MLLGILLLGFVPVADAQDRPRRPRGKANDAHRRASKNSSSITINYPDSVNLAGFVDYVSQSLDVRIIYSDELKNQTIIFRPGEVDVPRSQLLDLLRGMLRMHDLALVEGDLNGWLQIVQAGDFHRHVKQIRRSLSESKAEGLNRVVTQVVPITSEDMSGIVKHVQKFLSSPKASIIEVPAKKILIVTDYESGMRRALNIIRLIDSAPLRLMSSACPLSITHRSQ